MGSKQLTIFRSVLVEFLSQGFILCDERLYARYQIYLLVI